MNSMSDNGRLKIAIQKSGRLADKSMQLLEKCGISLSNSRDQLLCMANNFPLDVFLVRDDDIPAFLATNVCQLGILGQNALLEQQANHNGKYAGLEEVMVNLLLEYNNKLPQVSEELLEAVKEDLPIWDNKIKSCSLFNMYSIECDEFKEFVELAGLCVDG